jgi:hypothetical protein
MEENKEYRNVDIYITTSNENKTGTRKEETKD